MSAWSDGLTPDRLATQEARNRVMGISGKPPDPVGHMVEALNRRAAMAAERAWVNTMQAGDESWQSGWKEYGAQVAAQNAKTAAAAAEAADAKRQAAADKADADEEYRQRSHAVALALSAETAERLVLIRNEINAILEA